MRSIIRRAASCLVLRVAIALIAGLTLAADAMAETASPTTQARAAHAEFLTEAPPPASPAVVCVVDTGVDVNPDTAPLLVDRLSVYGGTGDDVFEGPGFHGHGTTVAMVLGAPANGWGMVGAWPHARVLSVRAMEEGASTFAFESYQQGIMECLHARREGSIDVRVIELAIARASLAGVSGAERQALENTIDRARSRGVSVVGAAGNDSAGVNYPASYGPTLAVGATDLHGGLCSFSARGPELDLLAPGCGLDVALASGTEASAGGTSLSSAFTAGVLAALRSYRPDLGPAAAEKLLLDTARGGGLDAAAAFRAAGLGHLVESYGPVVPELPEPGRPATRSLVAPPARPALTRAAFGRLRPRLLEVRAGAAHTRLRIAAPPAGAVVAVRLDGRLVVARSVRLTIRRRSWRRLVVRFRHPDFGSSAALSVRPLP